jgi:hypothetical protein
LAHDKEGNMIVRAIFLAGAWLTTSFGMIVTRVAAQPGTPVDDNNVQVGASIAAVAAFIGLVLITRLRPTLGPIVARMIAGAICGAGLSILFGFAVGSHTITANFLYWLALVPGTAAALGLIGAIIGASFVIAFTREE